jgi:hypothetical protein
LEATFSERRVHRERRKVTNDVGRDDTGNARSVFGLGGEDDEILYETTQVLLRG